MTNLKIGIISDLHIVKKTTNLKRALLKLQDAEIVLIVGDIADRAEEKQYDSVCEMFGEYLNHIQVYCVSGNHDNPAKGRFKL